MVRASTVSIYTCMYTSTHAARHLLLSSHNNTRTHTHTATSPLPLAVFKDEFGAKKGYVMGPIKISWKEEHGESRGDLSYGGE